MARRLRGLIFAAFFILFVICAPVVVLYTAGYRFNFQLKQVVQAGIISLQSSPKNATIFIDDKKQKPRTPAVLDNIVPGQHQIRVNKNGYLPWQKTVTVTSRQTAFLHEITLFLDTTPNLLAAHIPGKIIISSSGRSLLFSQQDDQWVEWYAATVEKPLPFLINRYPLQPAVNRFIQWSPDGNWLILSGSIFDVRGGKKTDIASLNKRAKIAYWNAGSPAALFIETEAGLNRWDAEKNILNDLTIKINNVTSDGDGYLFWEKTKDNVVVSRRRGQENNILAYLPLSDYRFLPAAEGIIMLEDVKNKKIFLLDKKTDNQPILLNTKAVLWQWWDKKLLYSDGFEIHVYDTTLLTDETITRFSEPLTGLSWFPNGQVILFTKDNELTSIELNRDEIEQNYSLAQGTKINSLLIDGKGRQAYFFGIIDGQNGWWRRPLQ